jgi:ATP-dependent RNA helicase RhlE
MPFSKLGLPASLTPIFKELGFNKPYPIQEQVIPEVLSKKDVLGIAKTGSGKTVSYLLPLMQNLSGEKLNQERFIDALILVPTRELAEQIKEVFFQFENGMPVKMRCMAVYGGVSINPQMKGMRGVNLLVATPGRLIDLLESKALFLSKVKTLVIDEADKMLNLGFKDEVDQILDLLPRKRQNLLFSATLSPDVAHINQIVLKEPVIAQIKEEEESIDQIDQSAYFVTDERKGPMLRYLIKTLKHRQTLVFVSSGRKADNVAEKLRKNGVDAISIHGKKSQGSRTEILRRFKTGQLDVLVATDLLARGIDIAFLPCVINYELPRSPKDYVHRIGRTGRAGENGQAISLISPDEEHHFKIVQKKMKKTVKSESAAEINLHGY